MKIRWKRCQRPIARQLAFEINVLDDDVVGVAVLACLSARMRAAQQRQVGRGSSLASGRLRKSLLQNNTTPRTSPNFDPSPRIIFFCDRVSIDIQSPIFRRGPCAARDGGKHDRCQHNQPAVLCWSASVMLLHIRCDAAIIVGAFLV